MRFYKAWAEGLRQERAQINARLESEVECACIHAAFYYCVQCEVRDINHQEKGACTD
jgi:hypothetical protein